MIIRSGPKLTELVEGGTYNFGVKISSDNLGCPSNDYCALFRLKVTKIAQIGDTAAHLIMESKEGVVYSAFYNDSGRGAADRIR